MLENIVRLILMLVWSSPIAVFVFPLIFGTFTYAIGVTLHVRIPKGEWVAIGMPFVPLGVMLVFPQTAIYTFPLALYFFGIMGCMYLREYAWLSARNNKVWFIALCDPNNDFLSKRSSSLTSIRSKLALRCYSSGDALLTDLDSGEVFDAYFVERNLPDMTGPACVKAILKRHPDALVAGMAAISSTENTTTQDEATDAFKNAGAAGFVNKLDGARMMLEWLGLESD